MLFWRESVSWHSIIPTYNLMNYSDKIMQILCDDSAISCFAIFRSFPSFPYMFMFILFKLFWEYVLSLFFGFSKYSELVPLVSMLFAFSWILHFGNLQKLVMFFSNINIRTGMLVLLNDLTTTRELQSCCEVHMLYILLYYI